MIHELLGGLTDWTINFISQYGWPAIFGMMFFGSASIPIPSWAVMPFGGFLVGQGFFSFETLILASTIGSFGGAIATWGLGYWGQEKVVNKLIKKYGKYIFVSLDDVKKVEAWSAKKGVFFAFLGQLIPVIRCFAGLTAGLVQMPFIPFALYTLGGILIWNVLLGYIGVKMGANWDSLKEIFSRYNKAIVIAAAALVGFLVYTKLKKHLGKGKSPKGGSTSGGKSKKK